MYCEEFLNCTTFADKLISQLRVLEERLPRKTEGGIIIVIKVFENFDFDRNQTYADWPPA